MSLLLGESNLHFSKLDLQSDPLLPQLLRFRALFVLQTLPLVHLTFQVRITLLKFGVGTLELVLFVLDASKSQKLPFEGRFQVSTLL